MGLFLKIMWVLFLQLSLELGHDTKLMLIHDSLLSMPEQVLLLHMIILLHLPINFQLLLMLFFHLLLILNQHPLILWRQLFLTFLWMIVVLVISARWKLLIPPVKGLLALSGCGFATTSVLLLGLLQVLDVLLVGEGLWWLLWLLSFGVGLFALFVDDVQLRRDWLGRSQEVRLFVLTDFLFN